MTSEVMRHFLLSLYGGSGGFAMTCVTFGGERCMCVGGEVMGHSGRSVRIHLSDVM